MSSSSDLVAELLVGTPHMPDAVCAGHAELFDPPEPSTGHTDTHERIRFALKLCRRCPELAACRNWLNSLPPNRRPSGIVAGLLEGKEIPHMTTKLGHPDNERTRRAPVDAVLIAQASYRDDDAAAKVLLDNCHPYSVAVRLCGWIFATFRQFDVDIEDRLGIWLDAARAEIGEDQ
jgi:hypothetical protein